MAVLAVGDRVLVTFVGTLSEQRIMNTFCFGVSAVTGTPTHIAALTALRTSINAALSLKARFIALCPQNYTMIESWYQVIKPTRFVAIKFAEGTAGGVGFPSTTPNVATTFGRRGELAQRKGLSTLHVPVATTEDVMEEGSVVGPALVAGGALRDQLIVSYTTAGTVATYNPVIDNGPLITDFTPIVSASWPGEARTMRRRTLRIGV